MLQTKCYGKADMFDGLRISVMRFTPKNFKYDLWMQELAPTPELLRNYRSGRISWQEYEENFLYLLANNSDAVDRLIDLASEQDVTIYCSERTPQKCHRRLVAEECKRKKSDLEIYIS